MRILVLFPADRDSRVAPAKVVSEQVSIETRNGAGTMWQAHWARNASGTKN